MPPPSARDIIRAHLRDHRRAQRIAKAREPWHWQEQHSPSRAVQVKIGKNLSRIIAVRRLADINLFDALTSDQEAAALQIHAGYLALCGGTKIKTQTFERSSRSHHSDDQARLNAISVAEIYRRWSRKAIRRGIPISVIIDVLIYGKSLNRADRERRKRHGWAKDQLIHGLDLYLEMRGQRAPAHAA